MPAIWFGKPKMVHKFKLGENEVSALAYIQMTADIPNEQRYENDISTIKNHQENLKPPPIPDLEVWIDWNKHGGLQPKQFL